MKDYKIYKMKEIKSKDAEFSDDEFDDLDNVDGIEDFSNDDFDDEEFDGIEDFQDDEFDGEDFSDGESDVRVMSHKDIEDAESSEGEFNDDFSGDEFDDEEFIDDDFGYEDEDISDDELDIDEEDNDNQIQADSNYQGNIRNVPGAFLVYKRPAEDSTFEELWLYTIGNDIKDEMRMRRAILAGTDIKPQTGRSSDNKQTAKVTSLGNVQYLNIFGIPN